MAAVTASAEVAVLALAASTGKEAAEEPEEEDRAAAAWWEERLVEAVSRAMAGAVAAASAGWKARALPGPRPMMHSGDGAMGVGQAAWRQWGVAAVAGVDRLAAQAL